MRWRADGIVRRFEEPSETTKGNEVRACKSQDFSGVAESGKRPQRVFRPELIPNGTCKVIIQIHLSFV